MDWTRGLSPRSVPDRPPVEPLNGEVFQIGPKCFLFVVDTMQLSAHVERVSVSRMRDFLTLIFLFAIPFVFMQRHNYPKTVINPY